MKEAYRIERRRAFLFESLPAPLERSSRHLQYFDNYIENTNLRIRSIRSPENKEWTYILEKRFPVSNADLSQWYTNEIYLTESEHKIFEQFEDVKINKNGQIISNELRFNRYLYELNGVIMHLDVFLWPLWGLNIAKAFFETEREMRSFKKPEFTIMEVTNNPFFVGRNLLGKSIQDVKQEIQKMIKAPA